MQVQIKVIKVKDKFTPNAKGGYSMAEVTYQNLTQGGKTEGKKLFSFGDYAEVYEAAKNWEEDQVVTLQNEKVYSQKDSRDYWTWVKVLDDVGDSQPTQEKKEVAAKDTAAPAKQQWVPDEVKQRLIVRQSSVAQAVNFEGGNASTIEDVLNTAQRIFDWVFEIEQVAKKASKKKTDVSSEVE